MRMPTISHAVAMATLLALMGSFTPAIHGGARAQGIDALEMRQSESVERYRRLSRELALSQQRQEEIAAEIDALKSDSVALTAALIQAVKTERKLGEDVAEIESRLAGLEREEIGLRESLHARRGTLSEVLAALQRMGLNPPPAILVRPEDALSSVRSAILLGAVVPELRGQTEALVADLEDLGKVMASIRSERERLASKRVEQAEEQERLSLLLNEKQRMQARAETRMKEERAQAEDLAKRAQSLQELIGSLETEIDTLRDAIEKSRGEAAAGLSDALPFAQRKGLVSLPVAGELAGRFGDDDSMGGSLKGDIVRTQSGAIVTAPADGTVLYAGPFRSYGQLLILNPGDGYHIVLAGMDRLSVSLGQSLLAGEPVGVMGEARLASIATSTVGNALPELYIEFRNDGKPIDPGPWWERELSGRTGNDT